MQTTQQMARKIVTRILQADSRGNIVRVLGLSREEADLFHRFSPKLAFSLAKWWKESGESEAWKFLKTPFAVWVVDNPGVSGNWRKLPYKKALQRYEKQALRDPESSGEVVLSHKGWRWIKYPRDAFGTSKCPLWVRDYLGHCGETVRGNMLVLFDPRGRPRVTTTLVGSRVVDIVGVGQSSVKEKYYPFLSALQRKGLKVQWPKEEEVAPPDPEEEALNEIRNLVDAAYRDPLRNPFRVVRGPYQGETAFVASNFRGDQVNVLLGESVMDAMGKDPVTVSLLDLEPLNLARRVARIAFQRQKHYRYDTQIVKSQTARDPKEEKEESRRHGYYTFTEFQLLPLKSIVSRDVWQESKIPRILEAFAKNTPLPPIFVEELRPGKYSITNGLHRYHASRKSNFTHIPALIVRMVRVPEQKQEAKVFSPGDWVRLDPPINGLDWGYVRQRVGSDLYEVIGGNSSGSDYVGDLPAFNLEPAPRVPRKVQNHILSHWMMDLD